METATTEHTNGTRTIRTTHTLRGGAAVVWTRTVGPADVDVVRPSGRVTLPTGETLIVDADGEVRGTVAFRGRNRSFDDLPSDLRIDLRARLRAVVREAGHALGCDREAVMDRADEITARVAGLDAPAAVEALVTDGALPVSTEGRVCWRKDYVAGGVSLDAATRREVVTLAAVGAATLATCEALAGEILPGAQIAWHVTDAAHVRETIEVKDRTRATTREELLDAERMLRGLGVAVADVDRNRGLVVLRVAQVPA